jgi:hypothetical protein
MRPPAAKCRTRSTSISRTPIQTRARDAATGSLFVEQNSRDRGALASATNEFLDAQSSARAKLVEQEGRLEKFRQRHGKEMPTRWWPTADAAKHQTRKVVESIATATSG